MSKVVIDMSVSLDGFVAGPDDGKAHPLGRHGGEHVFDWYFSGKEEHRHQGQADIAKVAPEFALGRRRDWVGYHGACGSGRCSERSRTNGRAGQVIHRKSKVVITQ